MRFDASLHVIAKRVDKTKVVLPWGISRIQRLPLLGLLTVFGSPNRVREAGKINIVLSAKYNGGRHRKYDGITVMEALNLGLKKVPIDDDHFGLLSSKVLGKCNRLGGRNSFQCENFVIVRDWHLHE